MVVMIVIAVVAGLVLGIALIWYLATRGSGAGEVSEADFDVEYDRLVADGEATEADRATAWREFNARQLDAERERLGWEGWVEE